MCLRTLQFLLILLLAALSRQAVATQYLVKPGDRWQDQATQLEPGDELILMPGRHLPAVIDGLTGTPEKPIVIRGLSPKHAPHIDAEREGISLHSPRHVLLQDIIITGATVTGLVLDDSPPDAPAPFDLHRPAQPHVQPAGEPWVADVTIRRVTVLNTGPQGNRDAIRATGLAGLHFDQVRLEGWGGAGIELVACQGVVIEKSRFLGRVDHSQQVAIQARAGTQGLSVTDCRFEEAALHVLMIGGASADTDFRPAIGERARAGSVFEAMDVQIEQCIIVGGGCAIAFIHADRCIVQRNTIIRPHGWVLSLGVEHADARFAAGGKTMTFGRNLIVWEEGDLARLMPVAESVDARRFVLQTNLWWCGCSEAHRATLGELPGKNEWPQVWRVDPKLDPEHRPTAEAAVEFGAHAF